MSGGASTGPKPGAPPRIHSIVAGAAVLLLLLAGGTAAYLSRPPGPTSQPHRTRPIVLAEAPKQTADSPAPPSAQPGHSRRTVTSRRPGADFGGDRRPRPGHAAGCKAHQSNSRICRPDARRASAHRRPRAFRRGPTLAELARGQPSRWRGGPAARQGQGFRTREACRQADHQDHRGSRGNGHDLLQLGCGSRCRRQLDQRLRRGLQL